MRRILILLFFLCSCAIFFSCISAQYFKTGDELTPLASNEEVTTFSSSKPKQKYQAIGLLRIRGGKLDKRIEKAKLYAREKGGNGIIVRDVGIITEPGTENVVEQIGTSTYETQEFVIIKFAGKTLVKNEKLEEAKDDIGKNKIAGDNADIPKKTSSLDYNTIPRATYLQLISNYKSLEGKLFKGSLFPQKIYKIPSFLKAYAEIEDRLVLLATKSGRNKLYLIINKDYVSAFRKKIKSRAMLDFVYSPVQVYTSKEGKHPVIKFVEEIITAKK